MKTVRQKNYKKTILIPILIIAILATLGAGISYALINSNQKSENSINKDGSSTSVPSTTNPATDKQIEAGNTTKENTINKGTETPPKNSEITINAYKRDGYTLKIDTSFDAVITDGSCTLQISNNNVTKSYTTGVQQLSNYSTCKGFEVPIADIGNGTWKLTVNVKNSNFNAISSKEVEV